MKTFHHSEETLLKLLNEGAAGDPHLALCPACLERLRFLQQFHQALEKQRGLPLDPRLRRLAETWQDGNLIRLQPYAPTLDRTQTRPGDEMIILAAQGEAKPAGRYELVGTFSAIPQKILLRVVLDHERHRTNLYLLTENREDAARARIVIGTPDGEQFITETNDNGVAVLREGQPSSWKDLVIGVSTAHEHLR
jgi:hypothetical protein